MNPHDAAEKIRNLLWSGGFPVDPVTIAKAMGIKVLSTTLPEAVSGALIKKPGEDAVIVLEKSDNDNRKRFTIGHELGHYVSKAESNKLDEEYSFVDLRAHSAKNGDDQEEIFANRFSACLLMPKSEVKKQHSKGKSHIEMALYFGVSNEAMKIRLKNLGLL